MDDYEGQIPLTELQYEVLYIFTQAQSSSGTLHFLREKAIAGTMEGQPIFKSSTLFIFNRGLRPHASTASSFPYLPLSCLMPQI